jgi:CheY-like chemotaxis protein
MVNLIINARDAMPSGGTVTISAVMRHSAAADVPGLGEGDYVLLTVADTGTGILPEDLDKVMEPFFTTKAIGKGSGLGLSMVYGFAKQSNGLFRLHSSVGEGTTAELWLPCAPERSVAEPVAATPRRKRRAPPKMNILLVDDHPEVRSTTAAMLGESGHQVFEAANGTEALQVLKANGSRCDLLISDYAMPHLSGTDFVREARALCPDVPALIITGYADADAISDRPAEVEVLQKPFTANALEAAIARVCERHGTAN